MAVYFVTGKLGAGKTLSAVFKIKEYLSSGRKVATNLDISLTAMFGSHAKNINLVRVPDKPCYFDLDSLGKGNTSYDESQNGLLVLDECGTWFNSRSWADKSRQDLINWFAHARKLGWDILFLVQSLQVVDKQSRLMFAEHVVYCRRADRLKIPFLSFILNIITLGTFSIPKIHFAVVKYGDLPTSLTVDRWVYHGMTLYSAYNTKQQFSDFYTHGSYCLLPPYYLIKKRAVKNIGYYMRLTKIFLKKYSKIRLLAYGVALTLVFQFFYNKYNISKPVELNFDSFHIKSFQRLGDTTKYIINTPNGDFTSDDLNKSGMNINYISACKANLNYKGTVHEITCK